MRPEDLAILCDNLGLDDLSERLHNGDAIYPQDYQQIQDAFSTSLGKDFIPTNGVPSEYSKLVKQKAKELFKALKPFEPTIPRIVELKKQVESLPDLISNLATSQSPFSFQNPALAKPQQAFADLQLASKLLTSKKKLKPKLALKTLSKVSDPQLKKELAAFLSKCLAATNAPLSTYSSSLFSSKDPLDLLATLASLGASEESRDFLLPTGSEMQGQVSTNPFKDKDFYYVTLGDCCKACTDDESAARVLTDVLIANGLADKAWKGRGFEKLSPVEALNKLAEGFGPDAEITTTLDLSKLNSSTKDPNYVEEEYQITNELTADKDFLMSLFPANHPVNQFIKELEADSEGKVHLSEEETEHMWDLWNSGDPSTNPKLLRTNPMNVLRACQNHPQAGSHFCQKYTLLLALWLNQNIPRTINLDPLPDTYDLMAELQDQFRDIGNIHETFNFIFDLTDLPREYFAEVRLQDFMRSKADLVPYLDADAQKIVKHFSQIQYSKKLHKYHLIVDRELVSMGLQVELSEAEAELLRDFMLFLKVEDIAFFNEYKRREGAAGFYDFEDKSEIFLTRFIGQIKNFGHDHKAGKFDEMNVMELLGCLQYLQTVNDGQDMMRFLTVRLLNSKKYGEIFVKILKMHKSVAEAIHYYTTWIADIFQGHDKIAKLVLNCESVSEGLRNAVRYHGEYMSSDDLFVHLLEWFPYEMELLLIGFYNQLIEDEYDEDPTLSPAIAVDELYF